MNIGVIGAGIGGLATATALARQGAQVTVFEQAQEISEVGAGLQISPNGLCVLRALGLEEALMAQSCKGQAVSLRRAESNFEVAQLDLTRLPADQAYHFAHRADLIELLLNAAQEAGVTVLLNKTLSAIEPGEPARACFDDGTVRAFDFIVDAGGLKSILRGVLNKQTEPFFTYQVAWRALIPNREQRAFDVQVHMAPKSHIVSYPIQNGAFLNLVAVQEREKWSAEGWAHKDDPENLRSVFQAASREVKDMLERVEEVHLWGLFRHPVATHWHGKGCALVGDAAHPTLPFLAQGANMALEDAWAISQCLAQNQPLSTAMAQYQGIRHARVSKVIEAANNNAWRYHLARGPLRLAAHTVLGIGSRVAPNLLLSQFDWLYGYDITSAFTAN